jgi:hypothetical protein
MQIINKISFANSAIKQQINRIWTCDSKVLAILVLIVVICASPFAEAGGKGKGGEEDIILYNGNIVMRGDKKGGSIVMANTHQNEEVEFSPSFFTGFDGYMGGHEHHHRR